jgi:hypothetical protein
MNQFIELLEKGDDISIQKLKKLFRILVKSVHPDSSNRSNEVFIKLKNEYDEAYNILSNGLYKKQERISPENARVALLKFLYHFYISVYSERSYKILDQMIELANIYNSDVHKLLKSYRDFMYLNIDDWRSNNKVYYAHNVVITGIMQFFDCYNKTSKVGHELAKKIYVGHRNSIEMWIGNSNENYKAILFGIHDWLEDELNKPSFQYYGI